jgi:hypothetical protein
MFAACGGCKNAFHLFVAIILLGTILTSDLHEFGGT